jgi:hypothetical protein
MIKALALLSQSGHDLLYFIFLVGQGFEPQGFMLAKQTLYHLSHSSSLFCPGYFWRWGSCKLFAQAGLPLWSSWSQSPKYLRLQGWATSTWQKRLILELLPITHKCQCDMWNFFFKNGKARVSVETLFIPWHQHFSFKVLLGKEMFTDILAIQCFQRRLTIGHQQSKTRYWIPWQVLTIACWKEFTWLRYP